MAGRINEEDIASVRERSRIEDVVGSYVALRNAGGGSLKGLCPFHDEKTPSFQVTPARGFYYCFGCGEGGDVITFLQRQQNLTFVEAVQVLADRAGIVLRVEDDGTGPGQTPGLRKRILEANEAAQAFYSQQLDSPEAIAGRQFLHGRGFDREVAQHFSIGYAPRHGAALRQSLAAQGFGDDVLKAAGLVRDSARDFFTGRVLWPIRDSAQAVLGFGARRIYDDDRMPAKYLNTPESPVYKKSHVLYGLDLARREIGKKSQAVVVEGYTDVMAAHLSGVETAVASCGTAFGEDHGRLLQRLMGTHDGLHGEVIFTFDGDKAGQAAALKVFKGDQNFISQTYVAIEPTGLDPCDLRIQQGEAAVRELVARRIPLYRFVMSNIAKSHDLDRADGRLAAAREGAELIGSIRDQSLVNQYLRELAGVLGMDLDDVRREAVRVGRRHQGVEVVTLEEPPEPDPGWPNPNDPALRLERDSLKLMLQHPLTFDASWNGVEADDFQHPGYRAVFRLLTSVEFGESWADRLRAAAPNELVQQLLVALLVEPLLREPDETYSLTHSSRLQLARVSKQIADLKSRLQRTDPVKDPSDHRAQFAQLTELEMRRKRLQSVGLG
ncbi:DNA primase [Tessaracoccus bendigoensis DSM 12906]|uniref:DNA primase n=1 Tax=Tessaracoccus bendigoensis DSM 12906 TaxID=1123357 RepID=A0A1M6M522_9ACTN|nr:DNA primase [Tessaracoccus bendigoensis]SHJ78460.1 DNA primase [Tessaracoccus bendigoensis DSM 12906]